MKADPLFPPEFVMAAGRLTAVNTITNHPQNGAAINPSGISGNGFEFKHNFLSVDLLC